jgi:hypothetical protein
MLIVSMMHGQTNIIPTTLKTSTYTVTIVKTAHIWTDAAAKDKRKEQEKEE